jgi:titin
VSTARTATVSDLTSGTTYRFRVAAVNSAGRGAWSASIASTPATVPGPPTDLLATGRDSSVELEWSPPDDDGGSRVSDYLIEQSTDGGASWEVVDDGIGTTLSALVNGLANGTPYWFRARAINAIGTSAPSAVVTATPSP